MEAHAYPGRAPGGIRTGSSGQSGMARPGPAQILQQSRSNPVHCPDGLGLGRLGLPAQIPPGPRPGSLSGTKHEWTMLDMLDVRRVREWSLFTAGGGPVEKAGTQNCGASSWRGGKNLVHSFRGGAKF